MYVERPDAKLFYQTTGNGSHDVVLCPPRQPAVYSRLWKNQIPYLSRYFRVTTMDPRGNGRSDRPLTGYDFDTHYGDLEAVLDAAVRPPFAFVAFSCASMLAVRYAIEHPERVSHLIFVGAQYSQSLPQPFRRSIDSSAISSAARRSRRPRFRPPRSGARRCPKHGVEAARSSGFRAPSGSGTSSATSRWPARCASSIPIRRSTSWRPVRRIGWSR